MSDSVCGKCFEPINGQYVQMGNTSIHAQCFVCTECETQLGGKQFKKKDELPYCVECHTGKFRPSCKSCNRKIMEKHLIVEGDKYHVECFICSKCTTTFGSQTPYTKLNDEIVCMKCVNDLDQKNCSSCEQNVGLDERVFVLDRYFHQNCFLCQNCKDLIEDKEFISLDQKIFIHIKCFNDLCVVCGQLCQGEYYCVENDNYCHVECIDKYDKTKHQQPPKQEKKQQLIADQPKEEPNQSQVNEQQILQQQQQQPQHKKQVNTQYLLKTMDAVEANTLDASQLLQDRPRYLYSDLIKNPPPEGVPVNKKELYLSDEEFEKIFKMPLSKFLALREWKRIDLKKQYKLF